MWESIRVLSQVQPLTLLHLILAVVVVVVVVVAFRDRLKQLRSDGIGASVMKAINPMDDENSEGKRLSLWLSSLLLLSSLSASLLLLLLLLLANEHILAMQ